jgi:hypothetical protein
MKKLRFWSLLLATLLGTVVLGYEEKQKAETEDKAEGSLCF